MILSWTEGAWEDYLYWQKEVKQRLKRINLLIKEIFRDPFSGVGSPEPLKHSWSGFWSRRIDREHRLVYKYDDGTVYIAQCRYHY